MAFISIFSLLVLICHSMAAASLVTLSQGGYSNVVVGFSSQVPQPANCTDLLNNLEVAFRESSRLLHTSTGGRVYFRSISVLLPSSWNVSGCRNVTRSRVENYDDADFRVGVTHPLFGDSLWTQQSQDCGKPGDYVSLTPAFFTGHTNNGTENWMRGRRLLREWAKLRYGVFDEVGYYQDASYPSFYRQEMNTTPTACTDAPVQGHRLGSGCDSDSDECVFHPAGNNSHIHSSIMSYSQLPNVTEFCDSTTHNDLAPTKHNLLCLGQSVKDVIFSHNDFKSGLSEPVQAMEPIFHYKQSAPPRYILALDKSPPMDERDHWKYVRSATRRFVLQDMGDQMELGVLSFSDTVTVHTDKLVNLSSPGIREAVASAIPVFLSTSANSAQDSCLVCAVTEAISMLEHGGSSAAGDVILLVTSGTASADQIQAAMALATKKSVHISVIAFAYGSPIGSLRNLQSLTEATSGLMTTIASKGVGYMSHISMLIELGDALLSALQFHQKSDSQDLPVLVHEHEFGESASGWVNGSFYLDPTLGRDTVLAVYFYSRDFNTHVGDIRLISPDGTEHRGISETSMASLYVTPLAAIEKTGVWRYSFDRRSQSHQSHFVKVTSKLKVKSSSINNRGALSATLKIVPPAASHSDQSTPFVLLATVKSGQLPVLDARVRAIIQYTGRNSNHDQTNNTLVIDLLDNGNADPDITKGDGVYSRYFANYFRGAGTYAITLSVDAMDGRAYSIRSSSISPGNMECCGSVIRVPSERRELTGPFNRIVAGGILTVNPSHIYPIVPVNSTTNLPETDSTISTDTLPPSRITDLRVQPDKATQKVTFSWTAVGDDYDVGTAYAYELRISPSRTELRPDTFALVEPLPVVSSSKPSGEGMELTVDFTRCDRSFYCAARAIDRRGNKGRISNIVQVFMPCPPTTTTSWPSTLPSMNSQGFNGNSLPPQWFSGGLSTVHWAAIVASSCVAILILILVIYFVVDAKRRKEKEMKTKPKFAFVPPVNSTLYPAEKEIKCDDSKDMMDDVKPPATIYDGKTVPVHWSASQLLQEHERRHSPYGQNESENPYSCNETYSQNGTYPHAYNQGTGSRHSSVFSGSYHLNTASATYGNSDETAIINIYSSNGTASTTPPSESLASLPNLSESHRDYRPYSVDYEASSLEHDGYLAHPKARPPTFPKADPSRLGPRLSSLPLQGSFTSLASERKKRNVTQV